VNFGVDIFVLTFLNHFEILTLCLDLENKKGQITNIFFLFL